MWAEVKVCELINLVLTFNLDINVQKDFSLYFLNSQDYKVILINNKLFTFTFAYSFLFSILW